ncbi:hypothetical protein CFRA_11100 [Corynebacterium frankenforstense DSM 45800]|uniref:Uncharacterized protein n=1 Tax=Corynebacterium frankenforstense DSM 45800 TaxID=1437875 RepID=A0A1L7CV54_9CORY|nr:hypothetical protein CFRA_11100 [Corynebacterium frankenforstense DSM 45800]
MRFELLVELLGDDDLPDLLVELLVDDDLPDLFAELLVDDDSLDLSADPLSEEVVVVSAALAGLSPEPSRSRKKPRAAATRTTTAMTAARMSLDFEVGWVCAPAAVLWPAW